MSAGVPEALAAHLSSGHTTLCHAWAVMRRDGRRLGFTDHDRDLAFEGITFRAGTGLSARALSQTTGLSVDNSEALGALSDAAICEDDIAAGRYDGALVRAWRVNWAAPEMRVLLFAGTLGEITRNAGLFEAELRGLGEMLNQPQGEVYQRSCTAVLGDRRCRAGLDDPRFRAERVVSAVERAQVLMLPDLGDYPERWFCDGRLEVLEGPAAGLSAMIRDERSEGGGGMRRIALWEGLRAPVAPGTRVQITAGCDRRAETCRDKFANFLNFRGFPHVPGDDWLVSYPVQGGAHDGGSLYK